MARAVIADPGEEDIVVSPDLAHPEMLPPEVTVASPVDVPVPYEEARAATVHARAIKLALSA
jgi:hypothetical protein